MSRVRDGIYKRRGRYAFRYKDQLGEWHEHYCKTDDRETAITRRDDFLKELKKGQLPNKMADWRADAAWEWWKGFRARQLSETNRRSEPYRGGHLVKILNNPKLVEISNLHLDTYQTQRTDAGIAPDTVNREVGIWSQILRKAKLWHRLEADYRPLKVIANPIGQALTRAELRHLADTAASTTAWEPAFFGAVLASNTGMRYGEISTLRLADIHLDDRRIVLTHGKSAASVRHVKLNADATEAVARLMLRAQLLGSTQPEHHLMPKCLSHISYGPHKGERGYDPLQHQVDWGTAWTSLTKAAGLAGLRFHDLRHTFISHMVERGVPIAVIMAMVGHISARMLKHYTHVSSGITQKAVGLLDAEPMLTPVLTGEHHEVIQ